MKSERKLVIMDGKDFNGNALHIMDSFIKTASNQQWSDLEINSIIDDAVSKDYSHFLKTIAQNTTINELYNEDTEELMSFENQ